MEIKLEFRHIMGFVIAVFFLVLGFYFFYETRWFKPLVVVCVLIAASQYIIDFLNENRRQREIETKFLEFVRHLVETVKSGTPIPLAIVHISTTYYGALTPHVQKLARQIELGIPTREALVVFANDTKNKVIKRSISIVVEAERSGGNIEDVLVSVTHSVLQVKKLREERKSSSYSQTVQGYIIFFIFIGVMLVLQVKLLPQISDAAGFVGGGFGLESFAGNEPKSEGFENIFLWLILIQGFFAGLMIGKFSEGDIKQGVKHSIVLVTLAYIVITTVRGF